MPLGGWGRGVKGPRSNNMPRAPRNVNPALERIAILNQTRHKRVACVRIEQIDCCIKTSVANINCLVSLTKPCVKESLKKFRK